MTCSWDMVEGAKSFGKDGSPILEVEEKDLSKGRSWTPEFLGARQWRKGAKEEMLGPNSLP